MARKSPPKTYMSGERYEKIIKRLGIPWPLDAEFLGVHRTQTWRWRCGHTAIDKRTAMLLEYMDLKSLKPGNIPQPRPWQ